MSDEPVIDNNLTTSGIVVDWQLPVQKTQLQISVELPSSINLTLCFLIVFLGFHIYRECQR